jgi:hypothetical protein
LDGYVENRSKPKQASKRAAANPSRAKQASNSRAAKQIIATQPNKQKQKKYSNNTAHVLERIRKSRTLTLIRSN